MRGYCTRDKQGYHRPTVLGDPWDKMTYYKCLNCGEVVERFPGTFYGEERPHTLTLSERISKLEQELKALKEK